MRLRQCVQVRRNIGKAESAVAAIKSLGSVEFWKNPRAVAPVDDEEGKVGVTCDQILNHNFNSLLVLTMEGQASLYKRYIKPRFEPEIDIGLLTIGYLTY